MTTSEFREEFKLLYDNISSNAAPGLDDYEVSVYLTTAQLELVKKAYSGGPNKEGFEGNERRRRELSSLIHTSDLPATPFINGLESYSKVVTQPNWLYIIHEKVKITSSDTCINNTYIDVVPVTHDEYSLIKENPFRNASKRRALRTEISVANTQASIELICPETITNYVVRYVAVPKPIILSDLTAVAAGLTINGLTAAQTCLLNEGMHREILNRAVALAIRDYRENSLQNKIQSELGLDYKED